MYLPFLNMLWGVIEKIRWGGSRGVTILPTYEGYEVEKGTLFKYLGRAWSTSALDKGNMEKRASCWSAFSLPQRTPEPGQQLLKHYAKPPVTLINSSRWFAYPIFSVVQVRSHTTLRLLPLSAGLWSFLLPHLPSNPFKTIFNATFGI